jgi:hypothetical protein
MTITVVLTLLQSYRTADPHLPSNPPAPSPILPASLRSASMPTSQNELLQIDILYNDRIMDMNGRGVVHGSPETSIFK